MRGRLASHSRKGKSFVALRLARERPVQEELQYHWSPNPDNVQEKNPGGIRCPACAHAYYVRSPLRKGHDLSPAFVFPFSYNLTLSNDHHTSL